MGAYDDIIDLPHPVSARHPRMSMTGRAAQFSPFAALAGHGAAIAETARLTDGKAELTEDEKAVLDEKLRLLLETGGEGVFTYFLPDKRKDGGTYVTAAGAIQKIDPLEGRMVLTGGVSVRIEDILKIEAPAPPGRPPRNSCEC